MEHARRSFLLSSLGPLAALGRADSETTRPNILFCIADDWGWPHAGAYGSKWMTTPAFDRIAREGVLFNNCFTSNPKCSPCRASILTGRNTWQLEEATNHFGVFPNKWAVYPDVLEQSGYLVGYTGKGWGPGDAKAGGFTRNPAGPEYAKHTAEPPFRFISNKDYAANFEFFLEHRQSGQPFCFWLGGHEPHRAYEPGAGERAGKDWRQVEVPKYYPDNQAIRRDLSDYSVEVEHFDSHVGRALAKLEAIGELDNTIVVMTSDHGMPFPRVKGQIYEHGFHVPLAIRPAGVSSGVAGGMTGGRVIDDFINVRDFAPTFREAADLPIPATMTGASFLGILKSGKTGWNDVSRNRMLIGKERHDLGRPNNTGYPVRALRTKKWLYVRNYEPGRWPAGNPETGYRNCDDSPAKNQILRRFDKYYRMSFGKRPAEELYRVGTDSDCIENLAENPEYRHIKEELRTEMEAKLKAEGDPRMSGKGAIYDTYEYVGGKSHSYDAWLKNHLP